MSVIILLSPQLSRPCPQWLAKPAGFCTAESSWGRQTVKWQHLSFLSRSSTLSFFVLPLAKLPHSLIQHAAIGQTINPLSLRAGALAVEEYDPK